LPITGSYEIIRFMLEKKEMRVPAYLIPKKLDDKKKDKFFNFLKKTFEIISKSFISLVVIISLIILTIAFFIFIQFDQFSQTAGVSKRDLVDTFRQAWNTTPQTSNGFINILVLGVDSLDTRGEVPPLADTLMLASINTNSGKIKLLSLPRDIWSEAYKTKINALIAYGTERSPETPQQFPQQVIEDLTAIKIHHTIVLSIDDLAESINLLGGVEIEIPQGFIDSQFPRTDVDITVETNPTKLYETIEFKQGKELMNGDRALKYIRSRHSDDLQAGTDLSRGQRQQQVIQAIFYKLKDWKQLAESPQQAGKLYKYYDQKFNQYLSIKELISTGKVLYPHLNEIDFVSNSLSIYPEDQNGVIYNPPIRQYQGQWVFEIRDLEKFRQEVKQKIN
jgi:LCP family protein required for cell wall assembly